MRLEERLPRMKTSNLLKWAQNHKNNGNKPGTRNWIHPPEALLQGHIAYLVKFLGSTEVEQPKGIEVVKEGVRKLRFSQQLRKAEGQRTPKVELTISADGVGIQEPKTKRLLHQYPLHRISYCADDKAEKKFFSFIAKEVDTDQHTCFVFVSDKLAEEITLTIGQAFDLAYRRFLETTGKDPDTLRVPTNSLPARIARLEKENATLRQRLKDLQAFVDPQHLSVYLSSHGIMDLFSINEEPSSSNGTTVAPLTASPTPIPPVEDSLISIDADIPTITPMATPVKLPPVPPRVFESTPNGNQTLDPLASTATNVALPTPPPRTLLSPPPSKTGRQKDASSPKDLFGADPFVANSPKPVLALEDPFGMGHFSYGMNNNMSEIQEGLSRGLNFGQDDLTLESLDPFRT